MRRAFSRSVNDLYNGKAQLQRKGLWPAKPKEASELLRVTIVQSMERSGRGVGCAIRDLGADGSEVLEVVPIKFTVTRYIRLKRSCCRCAKIVQPPAPSRPASLLSLVLSWK